MIQLIATPERWDECEVVVVGYLHLEFESLGLFLHFEDSKYLISENGLWLKLSVEEFERWSDLNDQYVLVEGTFDSDDRGHLSGWSGSIKDISRMSPVLTREELRELSHGMEVDRQ